MTAAILSCFILATLLIGFIAANHKLEKIMAAIDDLTTAETNLETVVGALITDIQTLAAELATAQAGNDDVAVEAVVGKMNALATSAQAVLTPPVPAPAP